MTRDSIVGSAKTLGGKMQEGLGRTIGDTKIEVDGVVNQAAGAAQELYGKAKEGASDAAEAVRQGAADADDFIRQIIETRPYTTAIVALCVGWIIGRMGRND
jgi:uncharacterized protein YjbJ (UPF0337 family)